MSRRLFFKKLFRHQLVGAVLLLAAVVLADFALGAMFPNCGLLR